jgi:hypothetical protein
LLRHDEFSILPDHPNLTYIYNPLSVDPTLARHVVHKLQGWALKMSVFSYRMEHVMGDLNYWTDLMTRWGVGLIAGSENKAHGKMASLFAQPYISPPDYEKVVFPSKKEILLVQQSAVNENERCQQRNATARQELSQKLVDASGMKMMNSALWIPERAIELQLRLCVEAHCRSAGHRAYEDMLGSIKEYWHGHQWQRVSRSMCRTLCTVSRLFLETKCHARWVRSYMQPSTTNPALRLPILRVVKRQEVSELATSQG